MAKSIEIDAVAQQQIDAEECLLGTMMLDANTIDEAQIILGESAPNCFTRDDRRDIWAALIDLHSGSEPVELLSVERRLIQMEKCEQPDTREYLLALAGSVASTANIAYHAKSVLDAHRRRVASGIIATASRQINDQTVGAAELIGKFAMLLSLVADNRTVVPQSARSLCAAYLEDLRNGRNDNIVSTGFGELDERLGGGLYGGDLIILAARPGQGKSAMAMQIALHAAQDVPVSFMSLEMSGQQLAQRMISLSSGVFMSKLRSSQAARHMREQDWIAVESAEIPAGLHIENASGMKAAEFQARARVNRRRLGSGLIIIDYLGRMPGSGEENRNHELETITRTMKDVAQELNIPVLCLSQLSRDPAKQGRAPQLSDLRDSGAIEQDADVVLMLHAKEKRDREGPYDPLHEYEYDCMIEKQRQGAVCRVQMRLMPSLTMFREHGTAAACAM